MGEDNGGKRGGFWGTGIKDTWTKLRGGQNHRREVGMAAVGGEVVGGKCRQLYLDNKIIKK